MQKEILPITDVVWFQEGPGVRNTQYTTSGVKLLNVANLVDGNLDLTTSNRYIAEEEAYGKYRHFLVDEGDLIIASSGIQVDYFEKKMGFAKKEHLPLCMNTSTIRFKNINKDKLLIKYFMYYLQSNDFKVQLSKYITGSAQLNFGPSHLKKMFIPLPPLKEQRKIAEKLDKVSKLIDQRKEQLTNLDLLIKSQFITLLSEIKKNNYQIYELGNIVKIGSSKRIFEKEYQTNGVPFYRSKEIVELAKKQPVSTELFISCERYEEIKNEFGCPKVGDLLITAVGTIGVIWVVNTKLPFYFKDGNLIRIEKSTQFNSIFLKYQLTDLINEYKVKMATGTAYSALTIQGLKSMQVSLPPIELQNKFAEFVERVDKLKAKVNNSLTHLTQLKQSLMQQYFN